MLRSRVRIGSSTYADPKAKPTALVGRGGQLLLIERQPFCPFRDCRKQCGPGPKCTCRICHCPDCKARRLRWARPSIPRPVEMPVLLPPIIQPRLFAAQLEEVRPVRPQQQKPYRQGDVLVIPIDEAPARLTPVPLENGRLVLAHSAVTGHAHVIEGAAELFVPGDIAEREERFLRVDAEVALVHDEHDTIPIPPGNYLVRRQREYAPDAIRTVAD